MSGRGAERVLHLIEWFSKQTKPIKLSDASDALELPKSSTLGLLRLLVDLGYVLQNDTKTYVLKRLPGEVGADSSAWGSLVALLEGTVKDAVRATRESGYIAVLNPLNQVVYLNKILPDREIYYDRNIEITRQPHLVSSGLVLLSGLTSKNLQSYIAKNLPAKDPLTPEALMAKIKKVADDGVAINLHGVIEGASGVAAPIYDYQNNMVAALNISGPAFRVAENITGLAETAKEYAAIASEILLQSHRAIWRSNG